MERGTWRPKRARAELAVDAESSWGPGRRVRIFANTISKYNFTLRSYESCALAHQFVWGTSTWVKYLWACTSRAASYRCWQGQGNGCRVRCTAVTTVNQHVPWVTRYLYVVLGPNFAFAVHHFHLCSRPEWAQVAPARLEVGLARWAAPRHLELPIHDSS